MELLTVEGPLFGVVAEWLRDPDNARWLDFGPEHRELDPVSLKFLVARPTNLLRVFTDDEGRPAGLVALSEIHRGFGTANLWYVLGRKDLAGKGLTSLAVARLVDEAFDQLGLRSLRAWAVDANGASIRVLEKNGFQRVGRLRRCHLVDGVAHDRALFDLLAGERPPR
jgi:ribosomal-protein-alanine N-acetyltransferase